MTRMRIQAMLQGDSGLAEDQFVNTWHFDTFDGGVDAETDFAAIVPDLLAFYQGFDNYLSAGLSTTITFTGYDLGDAPPRTPFATDTGTLTLSASNGMPQEVAVCLSYTAQRVSGINPARKRGRVYIGPLATNVIGSSIDGEQRPDAAFTTALATAAGTLLASTPAGNWWSVYSPTQETDPQGSGIAWAPVVGGWVDNAWDIQRRRGSRPSTRTTF